MLEDFLKYKLLEIDNYTITIKEVVISILVIIFTKILLALIKKTLFRVNKLKADRQDDFYVINKIIAYVFWIVAIIIVLNVFGVKTSALLTGSAALLVGVGLGLQQTFNDFISGVILLFEGKTRVGDILEIDGKVIKLSNIGLRTTEGVDRDGISIIIPNSKIINDRVINWTHQKDKKIRFRIKIGIAYGSDVELAIKLLETCAKEHPAITDKNKVEARFVDFGESSLNFDLLFFTKNVFRVEKVKSEIRRSINNKFIQNNIIIPFPQMDIHFSKEK